MGLRNRPPLALDERAIDGVLVNTHIVDVVVERELKFRIDHAAQAAAKGKVQNQEERLVKDPLATPDVVRTDLGVELVIKEPSNTGLVPLDCVGVPILTHVELLAEPG